MGAFVIVCRVSTRPKATSSERSGILTDKDVVFRRHTCLCGLHGSSTLLGMPVSWDLGVAWTRGGGAFNDALCRGQNPTQTFSGNSVRPSAPFLHQPFHALVAPCDFQDGALRPEPLCPPLTHPRNPVCQGGLQAASRGSLVKGRPQPGKRPVTSSCELVDVFLAFWCHGVRVLILLFGTVCACARAHVCARSFSFCFAPD